MIARGETANPTEVIQIEPGVSKQPLGTKAGLGGRSDLLTPDEQVFAVRKLFNLCDTVRLSLLSWLLRCTVLHPPRN
jgi:hypothetical protein